MKKNLSLKISFLLITILLTFFLSEGLADWFDPAWPYRRPVVIDNTGNSNTLYDFQVEVYIPYYPEMQDDFEDIRFTIEDGITSIPYWLEEYNPSDYAIAWVKVPVISAFDTTIIYLYYGNPDAVSESDGEAVFDFFDDFDDQNISDWTIIAGEWTADNKFLEQLLSDNHRKALSPYSFDFPSITEAKMNYLSSYIYAGNQIFFSKEYDGNNGYKFGYADLLNCGGTRICRIQNGGVYTLITDGTIHNGNYPYVWLKAKVTYDGTGDLNFLLRAPDSVQVVLNVYDSMFGLPFILGVYCGEHIGIDDLRVRKFADPEPNTSIGEEQMNEMIIIEPDHYDSTGTGVMKTYSIYVENQGSTEDIVEITKQWTELNWDVRIRDALSGDTLIDHNGNGIPDIDTLFPNETRYLFVDIIPTDSCFAGTTDTTVIKAYFAGDTATSDTCYIITKIITDISLTIDPDQSGNILPGESINYSLDITNYGNIKDVVDVTSISSWPCVLLDSTGTPLIDHNGNFAVDIDTLYPFGTTCGIAARIISPASANPGDVDTALVLVRFTSYPDTVDTATLITTVISPGSTLVLIDPDQTGYVDAGSTKVYNLTVRNLGLLDDVIDIISNGTSPGWSCSLLDSSGNPLTDTDGDSKVDVGLVPSGGSVLMKAGITSPIAAQGGDIDSTVIWAVSSIDTSVKDNAHLVTIVNSSVAVLIEPDSVDSVSPGDTVSYNLAVSNLGNSQDIIDITFSGGNADWYFEIVDENGLPLQDTDSDGKLDVGSVLPNSSVNIRARVGASDSAVAGDTDIRVVYATSSNNENIYDTAMLITYITGSVTLLLIDPDYSERLEFGIVRDYALRVVLEGTARDYVEVYPAGTSGGWTYELLDSGLSPLVDSNSNGMFDIGWMELNDTVGLYIRVHTPTGMVGLDSLSLKVVVNGETEVYSKEDSAVVYSYIVPALEIHNYASPFMDRTTFRFSIPEAGRVYLNVYNRLGERVRVLLSGKHYQRGIYKLPWDGRNDYSKVLAPAVYYYVFRLKRDSGGEDKIIKKTAIVR